MIAMGSIESIICILETRNCSTEMATDAIYRFARLLIAKEPPPEKVHRGPSLAMQNGADNRQRLAVVTLVAVASRVPLQRLFGCIFPSLAEDMREIL